MRLPGEARPERIGQTVQTIDIAPTIVAALGLRVPGWMAGQSLLGAVPPCRRVFAAIAARRVQFRGSDYAMPVPPFFSLGGVSLRTRNAVFRAWVGGPHADHDQQRDSAPAGCRGPVCADDARSGASGHHESPARTRLPGGHCIGSDYPSVTGWAAVAFVVGGGEGQTTRAGADGVSRCWVAAAAKQPRADGRRFSQSSTCTSVFHAARAQAPLGKCGKLPNPGGECAMYHRPSIRSNRTTSAPAAAEPASSATLMVPRSRAGRPGSGEYRRWQ